ncbi:5-(carboxyamino)imidazole ribonucleotide synthase [Pelagibacteraceae bacterium]|nr:5-(carboxyamino)imidazole ribonucleotide synthase [Pelagibacteraceae bacterium]
MSKNQTVGVIGGGQLGTMLCQAAKKLKIKSVVISDDKDSPAQNFCDQFIYSSYHNQESVKKFIKLVDVVTYEFENIPFEILKKIDGQKKVIPKPEINQIVQNRQKEKTFLNDIGIKTTEWAFIKSNKDIKKNKKLLPGLLKTNTLGYDGHGQLVLGSFEDIKEDWCFKADYILEKIVKLKQEISVIVTRFNDGKIIIYEPIENIHKDQILRNSKIPANISKEIFKQAQNKAKLIADKLNFVGTMCVEYFIDEKDKLLINEIAPRVHNSGHLTINAFNISQFENHIRAVCDLKMEPIKKMFNADMNNILGPEIENYRKKKYKKNEFFFDYLKKEAKEKRKMGHLTVLRD